jgi:hypothetical protein
MGPDLGRRCSTGDAAQSAREFDSRHLHHSRQARATAGLSQRTAFDRGRLLGSSRADATSRSKRTHDSVRFASATWDREARTHRHRGLAAAIVVLLSVAAACGSDDASDGASGADGAAGDSEPIEGESSSWLFVVDAGSGTAADGTLTLGDVGADVVAFSDRPVRKARTVGTAELVDSWAEYGFVDDPPNAALTAVADGAKRTSVVVLTDPAWDAGSATLTFGYDVVDERPESLAAVGGSHEEPAASFERVALFVDASGPERGPQPPPGQATISDISESEYQQLLGEAQQASKAACVSGAVTVCTLVTGNNDQAAWTVFAEAGTGVSTDGSAAKLTVQSGSSIQAQPPRRSTGTTPSGSRSSGTAPRLGCPAPESISTRSCRSGPTSSPWRTASSSQPGPASRTPAPKDERSSAGPALPQPVASRRVHA